MKMHNLSRSAKLGLIATFALATLAALLITSQTSVAAGKPDSTASAAAFQQVHRVLTSPRCQNCHPSGDAPLQGEDSHVHLQNVRRGADGHGFSAMRCDTCHQSTNLPGAHMPRAIPSGRYHPPNTKWFS